MRERERWSHVGLRGAYAPSCAMFYLALSDGAFASRCRLGCFTCVYSVGAHFLRRHSMRSIRPFPRWGSHVHSSGGGGFVNVWGQVTAFVFLICWLPGEAVLGLGRFPNVHVSTFPFARFLFCLKRFAPPLLSLMVLEPGDRVACQVGPVWRACVVRVPARHTGMLLQKCPLLQFAGRLRHDKRWPVKSFPVWRASFVPL